MKTLGNRWLVAGSIAMLLLALAAPAFAGVKEDMHGEMISIVGELNTIKGNPLHTVRTQELLARYQQLSDTLGGDDPGQLAAPRPVAISPFIAPSDPPNCATGTAGDTSSPALPVDNLTPASDTIAIAGAETFIYDVDVTVDITHTFAADLEFFLTSPSGTVITLSTDNGGGNDDVFSGSLFDDQAGASNPPGPVGDNTYVNGVTQTPVAPEEPLAGFFGEDPNGTWTLDVMDDAGGDAGTLNSWTLTITTLPAPPIFDPTTVDSSSPGLAFDNLTPVSDTITVAGSPGFICEVQIVTDITHTFASDIEFFLTSPAGTVVTMSTDNGGGNDDVFSGTRWQDATAGESVNDTTYVNGVTATPLPPEEALAAFIGETGNGDWVLDVTDDAGGDAGTLNSWSVEITACSCVLPEADLAVEKTGVASGSDIIWTIGVENNGPDDATGVVVTDPLDPCTTYVSDDCGGSDVPPWTWNIGNLPNGAIAFCNVTVDASACGANDVFNTAMVMGNELDSTTTNQASTTSVAVGSVLEIPTLGTIGLVALMALLALGAVVLMRRRTA